METTNNMMTAERSLEIIKQHIAESRESLTRNSAKPLIVWGVLVATFALGIDYLCANCGGQAWHLLWFVMTGIGFGYNYHYARHCNTNTASFVSKAIGYVWNAFAIMTLGTTAVLFCLLVFMPIQGDLGKESSYILPITPIIILMMGLAGTTTGFLLKNKWVLMGAIVGGIGGAISSLCIMSAGMLILAAVSVVSLVLPGVFILIQYKK